MSPRQLMNNSDTNRGHWGHSRGNYQPFLPQLSCLDNLSELTTQRTSDRMVTEVRKAPHLPAIASIVLIIQTLGHSYDHVTLRIGPTTIAETRIVPGSLRAEKSA
jgi:hypothetical protein